MDPAATDAEPAQAPSGGIRGYMERHGVQASDVPKAIALHEAMGLSWLAGSWWACYRLEPSSALAGGLADRFPSLADRAAAMERAKVRFGRWSAALTWIPALRSVDRPRLALALAESMVCRNVLRPATVPGKLLLCYWLIR